MITGASAAQLRVNGPGALERGCSFEPPTAQMSDFNASDVVVTLRQPEPLQPIRNSIGTVLQQEQPGTTRSLSGCLAGCLPGCLPAWLSVWQPARQPILCRPESSGAQPFQSVEHWQTSKT